MSIRVVFRAWAWFAICLGLSASDALAFGKVIFQDGTDCYNVSPFFKENERATISLYRDNVRIQGPFTLGRFNEYFDAPGQEGLSPPINILGNFKVKVTCGGTTYTKSVSPIGIPLDDIVISINSSPIISNFAIKEFNGIGYQEVRQTRPGNMVRVTFTVNDFEAAGVELPPEIRSIYGTLTHVLTEDLSTTAWRYHYDWQLPNKPGLYDLYISADDGKGGFVERAEKVDVQDEGSLPPNPDPAPEVKPSDKAFQLDHFLTFFSTNASTYESDGGDSRKSSCAYYKDLGFASACSGDGMTSAINFKTWKSRWGFVKNPPAGGVQLRAVYANLADLGLEREMNAIVNDDGAAFYVCNYPFKDAQLGNGSKDQALNRAIKGNSLVACVAMEYSVTPGKNGGLPFTKFLVFNPEGGLTRPVNLDGRGQKFIPGACVVCHGASQGYSRYDETPGTGNPAMGASFLPFDLNNFHFADRTGYRRTDQEVVLRKMNRYIRDHTDPAPAITELVNGWYPQPQSLFNDGFVPSGWSGSPDIYRKVVKPACRTCHVALRYPFNTKTNFDQAATLINTAVCGNYGQPSKKRYAMPNALVTFDRFWNSEGGVAGVNQPQTLRDYLRNRLGISTLACDLPD